MKLDDCCAELGNWKVQELIHMHYGNVICFKCKECNRKFGINIRGMKFRHDIKYENDIDPVDFLNTYEKIEGFIGIPENMKKKMKRVMLRINGEDFKEIDLEEGVSKYLMPVPSEDDNTYVNLKFVRDYGIEDDRGYSEIWECVGEDKNG